MLLLDYWYLSGPFLSMKVFYSFLIFRILVPCTLKTWVTFKHMRPSPTCSISWSCDAQSLCVNEIVSKLCSKSPVSCELTWVVWPLTLWSCYHLHCGQYSLSPAVWHAIWSWWHLEGQTLVRVDKKWTYSGHHLLWWWKSRLDCTLGPPPPPHQPTARLLHDGLATYHQLP